MTDNHLLDHQLDVVSAYSRVRAARSLPDSTHAEIARAVNFEKAEMKAAQRRANGIPEYRIVAFVDRARQGRWAAADRILRKTICGARRRDGGVCIAGPRYNGRCKWHGGGTPTPGPTTKEGRERIAAAARERWRKWREQRAKEICPDGA